jgi:hypothetical protein
VPKERDGKNEKKKPALIRIHKEKNYNETLSGNQPCVQGVLVGIYTVNSRITHHINRDDRGTDSLRNVGYELHAHAADCPIKLHCFQ